MQTLYATVALQGMVLHEICLLCSSSSYEVTSADKEPQPSMHVEWRLHSRWILSQGRHSTAAACLMIMQAAKVHNL
jgi:hypothetical protein